MPDGLNRATALSAAVSRAARPASKASAVLAVSGGIVASFAFPASAATVTTDVKTQARPASTASLVPAASSAPLASRTFGKIAFEGVVKPQPTFAPAVAAPVVQKRAINNRAINNRVTNNAFSRSVASSPETSGN